ncbi:MAG TPA: hypothetical protein DEF45_05535 [Rhodopirellula sp.]|nr:hypothetical protein [Rhodopirellula sp.]
MQRAALLLLFVGFAATRGDAEDLASFGLSELEILSDKKGEKVRGLGLFAHSTSASGFSVNVVAPGYGSSFNFFATNHNSSSDKKAASDVTAQPDSLGVGVESTSLAGISDIVFTLTNDAGGFTKTFNVQISAFRARASGQAIGGSDGVLSFNP